ncbi:MAG TPA: glycogen debranching N-terminal domain-containing protein [Ktedonobacteraceae bacterium]|jgi:glycogen debranching enzyme|nr:glycogen debranching N-terminal domain-containing protein [Ktedonobacteraceae bacterium]
MSEKTISVLEGNNFVVSDLRGDIDASPTETQGLFKWDTRFLSRWILTIDGLRPNVLSTDDLDYFYVQYFLVPGTGTIYVDADLSIIRKRAVGNGFHEDLTLLNHKDAPVDLKVRMEAGSDFADLFEVKDALKKKGEFYHRIEPDRLILGYCRENFVRETLIAASAKADIDERGLSFAVHIDPHGEWKTCLNVVVASPTIGEYREETTYGHGDQRSRSTVKKNLQKAGEAIPRLSCDWPSLQVTYQRSIVDLASLRFYALTLGGQAVPAAGLPWFMTIFGRDSMITSYQSLPFTSNAAIATLLVLAQRQGIRVDDFRDEEPGKIMHEARFGEMTAFEERPHSPYFGAADTTPLFLILLDEVERWTGNAGLVRQLEFEARAALRWIDEYGDRNGDGYVEYARRNQQTGLENQCWKDSWNSILFADGTNSRLPRATCEIQGYVYDAKVRSARLAREFWSDLALAERLEKEAAELKHRFNQDFWLADRQFFALAIDGDGRKVDSLTSNIGHLLWSGIVDQDKADAIVNHLMGPRLYSGWGVRTMAEGEGGYNPIGYHIGTVWPHDNSFIAMGLRRYGYRKEAARVAMDMLEAATYFKGRLPEAFAGYRRDQTEFPVEYPTACSPQAWASGAPLLLLRAILGLEPVGNHLIVDPAIPSRLGKIELLDIPGRWGHIDASGRGRIDTTAMESRPQPAQEKIVV